MNSLCEVPLAKEIVIKGCAEASEQHYFSLKIILFVFILYILPVNPISNISNTRIYLEDYLLDVYIIHTAIMDAIQRLQNLTYDQIMNMSIAELSE